MVKGEMERGDERVQNRHLELAGLIGCEKTEVHFGLNAPISNLIQWELKRAPLAMRRRFK